MQTSNYNMLQSTSWINIEQLNIVIKYIININTKIMNKKFFFLNIIFSIAA